MNTGILFTPWNIVKVDDKYIPFNFEYFEEDGLEYFDLIKYYYQVATLLKSKKDQLLVNYLRTKINHPEFMLLLQLYLIKEIIRGVEENASYSAEVELLDFLQIGYKK